MRKTLLFGAAIIASSFLIGCENSDTGNTMTYKTADELRQSEIELQDARSLKHPGKIYVKDDMILINEIGQGIHLVYNENPAAPKNIGFVKIPGNIDVAVKGDIIYADSYMDLVTLNSKTGEIKRVKGAFKIFEKQRREAARLAINGTSSDLGMKGTQFQAVSHGGGGASTAPVGTGGSMARFAIIDDNLYVLDGNNMFVYDVQDPSNPKEINKIPMDFNVETIFPHEGQLFIGGTEGMYIYDNTNPADPRFLSKFEHAVACDPVVVAGNYAYVTLRSGGPCDRAINQLDVVDISDINNPTLVKNVQMHNPHGLSVQENTMYLCDGNQGLKVFDVTDKTNILDNMKFADRDIRKAYDVIPNPSTGTLIVVGKEGIYQYDAMDPQNLQRISTLTIDAQS
jgi:hypothetical protein